MEVSALLSERLQKVVEDAQPPVEVEKIEDLP